MQTYKNGVGDRFYLSALVWLALLHGCGSTLQCSALDYSRKIPLALHFASAVAVFAVGIGFVINSPLATTVEDDSFKDFMRNAAFETSDGFKNSEPPDAIKIWPAFLQSLKMLHPGVRGKNPAMRAVKVGAILTTFFILYSAAFKSQHSVSLPYLISLDLWLVLAVLAANFVTVLTGVPAPADSARPPG